MKNDVIFAHMKFFRKAYIRKVMTVFTGIFFLNMSFFLAEISALNLDKYDSKMLENLVRSFSCVSEEERDATGESADSSGASVKEVDLYLVDHMRAFGEGYTLLLKNYGNALDQWPQTRFAETPNQPPEA